MNHSHPPHEVKDLDISIEGMSCASCVARVEKALKSVPGVKDAQVNLATEKARIQLEQGSVSSASISEAVSKAGYTAHVHENHHEHSSHWNHGDEGKDKIQNLRKQKNKVLLSFLLSLPLVMPMILRAFGLEVHVSPWIQFLLASPIQFWLGGRFYGTSWKAVKNFSGNMDLLVALGTTAAFGLSLYLWLFGSAHGSEHLYFESAAVIITLVLFGKYLEARAKMQTSEAISALQALRPEIARVKVGNQEKEIPVAEVKVGDLVIVKPRRKNPRRWTNP